jgi:hypothetical protein
VARRSQGISLSFLYWSLRRLLELAVLRCRSEREKEIEILLLRHQLRVLQRQVARAQPSQADRALLVAFGLALPRQAWKRSLFVTGNTSALASGAGLPTVDVSASPSGQAGDGD